MAEIESLSEHGSSNETTNTTSISENCSKKRKTMKSGSIVWEHFENFTDSYGETGAKCKYCDKCYAAHTIDNGESTLIGHMIKCAKFPHNIETRQTQLGFQLISGGPIVEGNLNPCEFDQELCSRALTRMIIVDEQPFSVVEKEGFKNFMKVLQPQFHIPSRITVIRDCFDLYREEKQKLKKIFEETQQRVCLTADTWTSLQGMNYMCLTTHFIDKDWTLHKKILNFCPITSHKCDDMATVIIKCLCDWGLDKVLTVTVDSVDDITVEELSKQFSRWGTNIMDGNHFHMRCMAHIINLIVQEGLEEVGDSVKRVRQAVRYIRQSSKRWRKFKACCLFERITCENSLCLDVPTRWDSTYLMLNVAQEFEEAFVRYGALDPGLMHYLVTYVCDDGKPVGSLVSTDWENVRHMVKILKPFYELTLKVSGSLYVTSNVHFEEICELDAVLKKMIDNENVEMSLMAKKMEDKLHKYFGNSEKMKMIFIASVLDPRNKFEYVAFALVSLFGEEKGEKINDEVKKYMTSLFDEYRKKNSMGSQLLLSSAVDTLDNSHPNHHKTPISKLRQKLQRHLAKVKSSDVRTELDKYLGEELENYSNDFNILLWWKNNSRRFPILAEMARDVLAIPVSTVASESAFTTGEYILDSFRSSLTPSLVHILVCAQDWLRSESLPVRVEENLDYLEKLELDWFNIGRASLDDIEL